MFLQTKMTNRRTFLARTALGAGSMFFIPELLTSCTDHPVPGSNDPIIPPVGEQDYNLDPNDYAKTLVASALGLIPEVGPILAALIDIFWPDTNEDVWGEVKDRVEKLVDQKISEDVYRQVKEDLQGLHKSLTLYLNELKAYNDSVTEYQKDPTKPTPDPTDLRSQWTASRNSFAEYLPHFQSKDYELPLLGLFAQFANMHLALLRDGVIKGKDWGRSEADQRQDLLDLQQAITDYQTYAYRVAYDVGLQDAVDKGNEKQKANSCEPGKSAYSYLREISLTVLDFRDIWPYYDVSLYPNGPRVPINRGVFSDMIGNCVGYDLLLKYGLPTSPSIYPDNRIWPTQAPTQLTIWGGQVIDGMQVTYPSGGGPYQNTQTLRMGLDGWTGGSTQPPRGGVFHLSPANPIVLARLSFNKYPPNYDGALGVSAVQFVYKDGAATPWMGIRGSADIVEVKPPFGQFISSIYFSAYLIVFGFQYINFEVPVTTNAIRAIYRTSPQEKTTADFAQAFPALGITQALFTDELKAARQAYWAALKARAESIK